MQVKICGVTHPDDALHVAQAGADYLGVIFSQISKRVTTIKKARVIRTILNNTATKLVGVFVNETVDEIDAICEATQISIVQLHAKKTPTEIKRLLKTYFLFYAVTQPHLFSANDFPSERMIPLFDNVKSENSKPFAWDSFVPPQRPWILAGGLNVNNVVQAIQLLNPFMVDVASGVERANSIRKDAVAIQKFINLAKKKNA